MTSKQFVILLSVLKEFGLLLASVKGLDPDLTNRDMRLLDAFRNRFKEKVEAFITAYKDSEQKIMEGHKTVAQKSLQTQKQKGESK